VFQFEDVVRIVERLRDARQAHGLDAGEHNLNFIDPQAEIGPGRRGKRAWGGNRTSPGPLPIYEGIGSVKKKN
jgi:hypothetical protein